MKSALPSAKDPHRRQPRIGDRQRQLLAGGPLPSAEVGWDVEASEGSYEPPNWSTLSSENGPRGGATMDIPATSVALPSVPAPTPPANMSCASTFTPPPRSPVLTPNSQKETRPFPTHIDATATVIDVNRQAWSSSAGLLLHPADRYVGLRTARYFVEQGDSLFVDVVVTDIDGNAIEAHRAVVRAALLDWEYREGAWREVEKETQECTVETTAASEPDDTEYKFASCSFGTTVGGEYRITATVVDGAGRRSQTELTRWVTGGQRPPQQQPGARRAATHTDSEDYAPGDIAEILVQAPFHPAEGLLTLQRDGLVSSERFTMEGPTYTLRVPVQESRIPNIHVQVDLVGAGERVDDAATRYRNCRVAPPMHAATQSVDSTVEPHTPVDAEPRVARWEPARKR